MALSAGIYWHPLDLPYYMTVRDLSEFDEAQISVPVTGATTQTEGSEYILSAVFAPTHAEMLSGDWEYLGPSASFTGIGYHRSGWQAIADGAIGEIYLGMILEVQAPADDLLLGWAELRCR